MNTINIVIADSQFLTRVGLRHLLKSNPKFRVVEEVSSETDLLKSLKKHTPEVIIIDYNQPNHFSVDSIKSVKQLSKEAQILVISSDDEKSNIYNVLEGGVNSFLTKQCDEEEIHDAIVATAKGEKFFCSKVLDIILERTFPKEEVCTPTPLSNREVEIVQLIAKGLIAKEIAAELNLSTHTVYTHRKNIMKKLEINSTSELILYALKIGIIESNPSN